MELSAAGRASGGYRGLDRRGGGGRGDGKRGDDKRGDGSGARLVDAWLASSQDGYCATTEEGEGDCVRALRVASSFLIWTHPDLVVAAGGCVLLGSMRTVSSLRICHPVARRL